MKYSEFNLEEMCNKEGIIKEQIGWTNAGNNADFDSFRCYFCLVPYKTWEESRACRSTHPIDMIPSQMVTG